MTSRDSGILRLVTAITVSTCPCDTFISSADGQTDGTECLQVSASRSVLLLDVLVPVGVLLSLFIKWGRRESQTELDSEAKKRAR